MSELWPITSGLTTVIIDAHRAASVPVAFCQMHPFHARGVLLLGAQPQPANNMTSQRR